MSRNIKDFFEGPARTGSEQVMKIRTQEWESKERVVASLGISVGPVDRFGFRDDEFLILTLPFFRTSARYINLGEKSFQVWADDIKPQAPNILAQNWSYDADHDRTLLLAEGLVTGEETVATFVGVFAVYEALQALSKQEPSPIGHTIDAALSGCLKQMWSKL